MFGFNTQPTAAPAPQATPDVPVSPTEGILHWMLGGGGPIDQAFADTRAIKIQNMGNALALQQAQLRGQMLQNASPDEMRAVLYGDTPAGKAFADRLMTHTLSGGQTLVNGGPGGSPFTATTYGLDAPSGQGYALGPNVQGGFQTLGAALPGEKKAADGLIVDSRAGPTGQTYSTPQIMAPGSAPGSFTPTIGGMGASGPAAPGPVGPAPAAASTAPRGIRNNNFGNLMALPGGQKWNGQVGVDPGGYAVFASPEDGVRAAATNLHTYAAKHGLNTVSGIVSRWAPAQSNNTGNYINFVAQSMGVKPDQPLNMADANVQKGLLSGIFHYENGPQQMAAWRNGGGQGAQGGQAQPGGWSVGAPVNAAHNLTPEEAQAQGYAPGAVVKEKPGEGQSVLQEGWSPARIMELRNGVAKDPAMENYHNALDAWGAMVNAAKQPKGGMRAYALRDTFARLINPGAVARVGTIEALKQSQGVPANVQAYLMNLKGDGDVPPAVAQQIMDVAHGFLASHYATVKRLNDGNVAIANKVKIDPELVQAPLDKVPGRFSIAASRSGFPQPDELEVGKVYNTPRGRLRWTGTGFAQAGGR